MVKKGQHTDEAETTKGRLVSIEMRSNGVESGRCRAEGVGWDPAKAIAEELVGQAKWGRNGTYSPVGALMMAIFL
jgi:hypothetical protein